MAENGHFAQACFIAQQAAEKSLEALAFYRSSDLVKSHSLATIAKDLNINGARFYSKSQIGALLMSSLIVAELKLKLTGRVQAAYIFGSASVGNLHSDSDIDLIMIQANPTCPFVQRGREFLDLLECFPKLDLLVYTTEELERQLADSRIGFWKSVRESLKQIL